MHSTDEQLNEYLDNETSDGAEIEKHLTSCPDCAARLVMLQALFAEMDSLPDAPLSRDLTAMVMQTLQQVHGNAPSRSGAAFFGVPRWLKLTIGLQAALALIAAVIAAPFAIEFASSTMPIMQIPSAGEIFLKLQAQWIAWLDMLSQLRMPSMPEPPVVETSSLLLTITLAGVSVLWLAGNGLLLKNQIK